MRVGVWALGTDRPGIVAAITGAVMESGGNLADTSMTILSGQFAMVLVVDDVTSLDELTTHVARAGDALGVTTSVRAIDDASSATDGGTPCVVSVHGADRPGIVHRIASELASLGANVTDLRTHVIGADDAPVYTMLIETELPTGLDIATVDAAVRVAAGDLGVDAHAHGVDEDLL